MFMLQREAFNCIHQSKFQSLLQTYVNEVYELMHDPEKNNFASRFKCKVLLVMLPKVAQRTMLCLSPALSQEDYIWFLKLFLLYINHSINSVLYALCLWGINCTMFFIKNNLFHLLFCGTDTCLPFFFNIYFLLQAGQISDTNEWVHAGIFFF